MHDIVIKLSSNLLNPDNSTDILPALAADVATLTKKGHRIIIVTSGAVIYGLKRLQKKRSKHDLPLLQSAAAIGQIDLMNRYQQVMQTHGLTPAQILLSKDDFQNRMRYLNLRNTLESLLCNGIIPVFNENDSINTEELKLGDNDHISAQIALMANFDSLILLSDVDGLFDKDPKLHEDARLIEHITSLDDSFLAFTSEKESEFSSGGMKRKLEAAMMAVRAGTEVFIGNGFTASVTGIVDGSQRGTYIEAAPVKASAKKRWLGFTPAAGGAILIDAGACKAITKSNSSLLPVGICGIEGEFEQGDLVSVISDGRKIGQGLTNYSSRDLQHILTELSTMNKNKFNYSTEDNNRLIDELEKRNNDTKYTVADINVSSTYDNGSDPYLKFDLSGYKYARGYAYNEVIHRDNMYIL